MAIEGPHGNSHAATVGNSREHLLSIPCIMLHDFEKENSLKTNMYILEAAELHHARAMMRAYPSSQEGPERPPTKGSGGRGAASGSPSPC